MEQRLYCLIHIFENLVHHSETSDNTITVVTAAARQAISMHLLQDHYHY